MSHENEKASSPMRSETSESTSPGKGSNPPPMKPLSPEQKDRVFSRFAQMVKDGVIKTDQFQAIDQTKSPK